MELVLGLINTCFKRKITLVICVLLNGYPWKPNYLVICVLLYRYSFEALAKNIVDSQYVCTKHCCQLLLRLKTQTIFTGI